MFKRKGDKLDIEINDKMASQMLNNVFSACSVTPNSIPLAKLQNWGKYNKTDFTFCQVISAIIMVAMLIVPVFFIPNSLKMSDLPIGDGTKTTLDFKIDSLIPVFNIKAALNGIELPVVPVKYNHFTASATENGSLDVTITLINGRSTTYDLEISSIVVDTKNPLITDSHLEGDILTVYITDDESGVDFLSAYAIDGTGEKINPVSFDEATGTISFSYKKDTMNIFVMDKKGNELHAIVSATPAK